jgi:hypothetical protein
MTGNAGLVPGRSMERQGIPNLWSISLWSPRLPSIRWLLLRGTVGTIEPLWNLLDLTPEGRIPDWEEQL